jgi:hypothetical protein
MNEIIEKFSQDGGILGLVILCLFLLVVFLVIQIVQLVKINSRIVDFKSAMYKAGKLPDRRGDGR